MQRADDSSSRLGTQPASPRSGLKPTTAFVLLLLLIAAVGGAILLTRPDSAPTPTNTDTPTEPNFALTNEEAIARFEELHQLELQAYRSADPSLVDEVFTVDSPIAKFVQREVAMLVRDRVVARPQYTNLSIAVIANTGEEIQLQQSAIVESHFFDSRGREITSDTARQRQTILWTLHLGESSWLLHDAVVTKSRDLD